MANVLSQPVNSGSIESRSTTDSAGDLVVVIPALNESATIHHVIGQIPPSISGIDSIRVVVVDDGSTDDTHEKALKAGATVVCHPTNLGVGAAFVTGIERALQMGADIIVNMDGDGQFQPTDIEKLIQPIIENGFGFVTCTRFQDPDRIPAMPRIKILGNKAMCWIVRWITGQKLTDVSCGFRAYTRETALKMNLFGRFTYTQESFIDLASKQVAITEVPLDVRGEREFGKSRVASNLFRYAIRTSAIILRAFRDNKPLLFFGGIAFAFLALAIACFGYVGIWWLCSGRTSPWTSLLFLGSASTVIGVGVGVLSLIADQLGRVRRTQDRLLYLQRIRHLGDRDSQ